MYEKYGKLEEGRAGAREFRIEWERLPQVYCSFLVLFYPCSYLKLEFLQPLQLHLDLMKAVKDKLPNGRSVACSPCLFVQN